MKKVTLYITRSENNPQNYLVVVNGEGFYNSVGKTVAARIRGDDEWFDDKLFSIGVGGFFHVGVDGSFGVSEEVDHNRLNEDWGRDEIYALVDVEGDGTYKSNTVTGNF